VEEVFRQEARWISQLVNFSRDDKDAEEILWKLSNVCCPTRPVYKMYSGHFDHTGKNDYNMERLNRSPKILLLESDTSIVDGKKLEIAQCPLGQQEIDMWHKYQEDYSTFMNRKNDCKWQAGVWRLKRKARAHWAQAQGMKYWKEWFERHIGVSLNIIARMTEKGRSLSDNEERNEEDMKENLLLRMEKMFRKAQEDAMAE
jgi:hypothetical protein